MEESKDLERMKSSDEMLKYRIRSLRLVSRVIGAVLSTAAFIPLAMTVQKFLSTKNIYHAAPDPNNPGHGIERTAWAHDSKTWPTFMYFFIALVSMMLNVSVLLAYLVSSLTSLAASTFAITSRLATIGTGSILVFNLVIWAVTVAIYRYEKNLHNKPNDLWGWTCSGPAHALQTIFQKEVQFNTYCNIQSSSFYLGLLHIGATLLTGFIYILAAKRWFIKRQVKKRTTDVSAVNYNMTADMPSTRTVDSQKVPLMVARVVD